MSHPYVFLCSNKVDSTCRQADCCGNLQTVRPEACWASFQTSDGKHPSASPYPNIVDSTFHQPQAGPPFSPEREMFRKLSFAPTYKTLLSTRQTAVAVCRRSDFRRSTQACFPLFTHRGINYPPSDKSDGPPFSPERSFVLQVSLVLTLAFLFFTREYSAALCHSR